MAYRVRKPQNKLWFTSLNGRKAKVLYTANCSECGTGIFLKDNYCRNCGVVFSTAGKFRSEDPVLQAIRNGEGISRFPITKT